MCHAALFWKNPNKCLGLADRLAGESPMVRPAVCWEEAWAVSARPYFSLKLWAVCLSLIIIVVLWKGQVLVMGSRVSATRGPTRDQWQRSRGVRSHFIARNRYFFFWHQWAQVSIHISPPVLVWVVKSIRKFPWMATGGLAVKSSPCAGYHHQACGFNLCCVGYTYNKCYQHWIYSLTMYTPAWCSVEKGALRALNQILRSKSWLIEMD